MASEVFIDSGGFYALIVPDDPMHRRADAIVSASNGKRRRFVTTDYSA